MEEGYWNCRLRRVAEFCRVRAPRARGTGAFGGGEINAGLCVAGLCPCVPRPLRQSKHDPLHNLLGFQAAPLPTPTPVPRPVSTGTFQFSTLNSHLPISGPVFLYLSPRYGKRDLSHRGRNSLESYFCRFGSKIGFYDLDAESSPLLCRIK